MTRTSNTKAVMATLGILALGWPAPATAQEPTREDVMAWQNRGEPRDDVERFKGVYRSASEPNRPVAFYETCLGSGHLAAAPMWADVPSWYLESESDLVFFEPEPPGSREAVRVEFEAPEGGQATAVVFSGALEGRFERAGDLDPVWQPEGDACYMPG